MTKNFNLSSKIINNRINGPAFEKSFTHKPSGFLNDLDLFTKGQPFDLYKELRENAPVFFHPPMLGDPEPGYWVLTRHEDIKKGFNESTNFFFPVFDWHLINIRV